MIRGTMKKIKKLTKKEIGKHDFKPYYAFGRIIKRPRGYSKCEKCDLIVHKDGRIVKKGGNEC